MFQNLQGTAIHTYANKILVVHTVTIPSPLVVALPIQSPMLMPVTYERCSYVLSFGGRCPYLNFNSFACSIQEMFLCSVLSLAHQPKLDSFAKKTSKILPKNSRKLLKNSIVRWFLTLPPTGNPHKQKA